MIENCNIQFVIITCDWCKIESQPVEINCVGFYISHAVKKLNWKIIDYQIVCNDCEPKAIAISILK